MGRETFGCNKAKTRQIRRGFVFGVKKRLPLSDKGVDDLVTKYIVGQKVEPPVDIRTTLMKGDSSQRWWGQNVATLYFSKQSPTVLSYDQYELGLFAFAHSHG